jgi:hypothetical protein
MSEAYEAAKSVAGDQVEFRSDVIVPGNAPITKPEASNEEVAKDPLFDKIAEAMGVIPETPAEEPKPEAEAKPKDEEPEDDAEPEFDDLSDDKPWTPERIKNAKAILQADRRKVGAMLAQLSSREKKFKTRLEQFRTEKRQVDLITRSVMTDLEALKTGSSEQALAALGRLAQRDPHSMYESMSLAMLGKAPQQAKESQAVKALEQKIEQLTAKLEQRETQQTEEQTIAGAQRQVMRVLKAAEEWPILAAKAAEDPEAIADEFWTLYERESRSAKRWLDVESFADRIERTLRRKSMPSSRAKQNGTTGSGPDREQETRASANPEPAQSPPRSLSPSQSAVSGASRRATTEDELKDELVRSGPDDPFFKQFGIQMMGF